MEIAYAFFARAAEFTPDGRFFVLGGGIEAVRCAEFPATLEALCLVLKLRLEPDECPAHHRLRIRSETTDGTPAGAEFTYLCGPIARPDRPDRHASLGITVNLQGVRLSRQGDLVFAISADDRALGSVRLFAELNPPSPASLSHPNPDAPGS